MTPITEAIVITVVMMLFASWAVIGATGVTSHIDKISNVSGKRLWKILFLSGPLVWFIGPFVYVGIKSEKYFKKMFNDVIDTDNIAQMNKLKSQFNTIESLKDNWDSYGANAPSKITMDMSKRIAALLEKFDIFVERVGVTADESVVLHLPGWCSDRGLPSEIEIYIDGLVATIPTVQNKYVDLTFDELEDMFTHRDENEEITNTQNQI